MFYLLYYILLSGFLIASIWIYRRRNIKQPYPNPSKRLMRQINYLIVYGITIALASYQILLWFVPKGTVLHENLRLIPHNAQLANVDVDDMEETRYPYGQHRKQYLILFQPKDKKATQERLIYYIHGGNWKYGSPESYKPVAKYFTDRGYNIFITSYRLTPQFGYEDMQLDISKSFRQVREILKEKNWSHRKLLLVGDSAGSNLAALLLYNRENLRKSGAKQSQFDAFISIAGALDISKMGKTSALMDYVKNDTTRLSLVNPSNYLQNKESVPVLAIHGTSDGCINYNCSKNFVRQLNTIRPNLAQMLTINEGTHLSVTGAWLYEDNEVKQFLDNWLDKKEQQVRQ